jgi:hypothetical protein
MNKIYKYNFQIQDEFGICAPESAIPLRVGLDASGQVALWMSVDPNDSPVKRTLFIVGTGYPFPKAAKVHVGSFVQAPFVWHCFLS